MDEAVISPHSNSKMKIRALTIGITITPDDFSDNNNSLYNKIKKSKAFLDYLEENYIIRGYEVQTKRISLNSIEEWLNDLDISNISEILNRFIIIDNILKEFCVSFCSLGGCSDRSYYTILLQDYDLCLEASQISIDLFKSCGNLGNFRFCTSFNCDSNSPYFPASFHKSTDIHANSLTIGLENGDLLFLAFHGVDSINEGRDNLYEVLKQSLQPVQIIAKTMCEESKIEFKVNYFGIDASINPGLSIVDSVGAGIENLLNINDINSKFGSFGTLAVVSAITSAIKSLKSDIDLIGYSGLMLPVMEDLILSERAADNAYSLRDLLLFSSVCGVGLDTVPVPGNITKEQLANIYLEVGALAFRLNKPLSCRLLPMDGKLAGDITLVDSPYLCNTKVFNL
eukprot:gene19884-25839_t